MYLYVLERLVNAGFESYVVGGSVRNELLNLPVKDYDICTAATPQQVQQLFSNVDMIGAHFGVCLVKDLDSKETIEVASFRLDGSYSDNRRPDTVKYTNNIFEDLERRDFTVNTFCKDLNGQVIDYLRDGLAMRDLNDKLIRCVGDPNTRFQEDALRMLRAIRFACQLSFTIEGTTALAIISNRALIKNISKERIAIEFNKILLSGNPSLGLEYLFGLELMPIIWPNLTNCEKLYFIFKQNPKESLTFYLTVLTCFENGFYLNSGINFFTIHKYDNKTIEIVKKNIKALDKISSISEHDLTTFKRFIRQDNILEIVKLYANIVSFESAFNLLVSMRKYTKFDLFPAPAVNGHDIGRLGITPGPIYQTILQDIETKQLENRNFNFIDAIRYIKDTYAKSATSSSS